MTPTGDFDSIQHIELPESPIHVTEHRLAAVYRDADGNLYVPDRPELKGPIFGPRMLASTIRRKTISASCLPTTWNQRTITANNKSGIV